MGMVNKLFYSEATGNHVTVLAELNVSNKGCLECFVVARHGDHMPFVKPRPEFLRLYRPVTSFIPTL